MQTKLFRRDFTLVVIGQIISLFGNAILRFALPLYLLRETGSSTLFGVVTACSFAPMVILSMVGGVLADRVNKRDIMVGLDFSTAAIIMLFYFSLGKIPTVPLFIVVLMLLYGISGTYQPAVQASVPLLVAKEKLMAGNAVINQVNTLSGLLGPVIGGVMFTLWGIYPILLLSAACFTFSAIMEIFIHIPHEKRPREVGVFRVVGMDLKESYQFVKTEKPIFFSVVFLVSIFNLVLSAVMIVGTPILITQVLGMSDTMYGFTQGVLALGGLCGGVLTAMISKKKKNSKVPCAASDLFDCCGGDGDFPVLENACHCLLLGNHAHGLHRYGSLYTLYGSDLHTGADADPASVSRQDHGGADFHCYVRAADWTGDLWCPV